MVRSKTQRIWNGQQLPDRLPQRFRSYHLYLRSYGGVKSSTFHKSDLPFGSRSQYGADTHCSSADLLLLSRAARLDRSIPLLIAHATAASNGTASCSDRASRSLAAGCAPAETWTFGRASRSSPNYQLADSSASMLADVYPAQPRNEAIPAIALPSASLLLTKTLHGGFSVAALHAFAHSRFARVRHL